MKDFEGYLSLIQTPKDLAQLMETTEDEVETEWFSPTRAPNGAMVIESRVYGRLVVATEAARRTLISMVAERLEKQGYPRSEGWTGEQIQDLEDVWERHKDD